MRKRITLIAIIVVIIIISILAVIKYNRMQSEFNISITIPAGSTESYAYSEMEISPLIHNVIIEAGDDLEDTTVILKPVNAKEKTVYGEEYLTHAMPVKLKAERGAWFKIGVAVQNPTTEDIAVHVIVKGVDLRIE